MRGETCNRYQARENLQRRQARENMQPVLNATIDLALSLIGLIHVFAVFGQSTLSEFSES